MHHRKSPYRFGPSINQGGKSHKRHKRHKKSFLMFCAFCVFCGYFSPRGSRLQNAAADGYIYASLKQATVLDVRQFIDDQPFSRYQLLVAVICGALVFMDGYDAQAMGFVGPALRAQLHISLIPFGRVVSIGLVGMMIGALGCGPIADRIGRKPVLVGCSFIFGIGTLLTAAATSLDILFIYRFITGLGLGGAMPNAIALTSEYAPKKYRATAVMTMF